MAPRRTPGQIVRGIGTGEGEAIAVPTDVTDPEAVTVPAKRAFGGIDVWIDAATASRD